ncbi:MAG: hypothetical protein OXP07_10745 [Defluviicoccus sp.]|nr:hypothetical protein [Defluviicoccus sp.]
MPADFESHASLTAPKMLPISSPASVAAPVPGSPGSGLPFHSQLERALVEGLLEDRCVSSAEGDRPRGPSLAAGPTLRGAAAPDGPVPTRRAGAPFAAATMENAPPSLMPPFRDPHGFVSKKLPLGPEDREEADPAAKAADAEMSVELERALLRDLDDAAPLPSGDAILSGSANGVPAEGRAGGAVAEIEPALREDVGDAEDDSSGGLAPASSVLPEEAMADPAHVTQEAPTEAEPRFPESDPREPRIDADLEDALLEGLSEVPSDSSAKSGPQSPRGDRGSAAAESYFEPVSRPEPGSSASDLESVLRAALTEFTEVVSEEAHRAPVPAAEVEDAHPPVPDMEADEGDVGGDSPSGAYRVSASDRDRQDMARAPAPDPGRSTDVSETRPSESVLEAGEGDEAGEFAPPRRDSPVAALAFATDPDTEDRLREGLLHFETASAGFEDPQVWPGGLRAAIAALADGYSTRLVIVDIDGVAFPAGAINELAEVCEIGTHVIAIGSDDSARLSRELLFAGVSDYLVKPVTAEQVHGAATRATASDRGRPLRGCVAGFVGTGGSGTTTVAAATAVLAAKRGSYVSVLDLNRGVSSLALLLDIEPAAGLDELLDVAGRSETDPQMVDGVRAGRSERISLYAYRWSPSPGAPPQLPAVSWLLTELRQRTQLVLVDGLQDTESSFALLDEVDTRVVTVEPTVEGAFRAARILQRLGETSPSLLVQNHTRAFRRREGSDLLRGAGIGSPADIVIPFEPSLPGIADRGWPQGRLPRGVRKPLAALADRVLTPPWPESRDVDRPPRGV